MSDDRDQGELAAQRLMALGELGAGVVHEVRNLVTSIRGFAQIGLRKQELSDDLRAALETIERESTRCVDTLSSYLGFARTRDVEHAPLDANDAVQWAARLVKHQLALGNVRLDLDLADELPTIIGNRGTLAQVLVNLALNGQHAMPGGGRLSLATRAAEGAVEIVVTDEGPGVPEELRDQIFQPFFTTRPNGEGTGLGLAISARIAAQHGGSLRLVPSATGACFVLRLPAREG